jgi:ribosome-binding factor A
MQHRDKRVADAIKETVARIILSEIADPKVGFVTVTRCHLTRDLRNATVYLSIMGSEQQQKEAFAHIEHACGYIRKLVGQRVKLRYLPELRFAVDDMLAHEMRINDIITDMHRGEPAPFPPAAEPDTES